MKRAKGFGIALPSSDKPTAAQLATTADELEVSVVGAVKLCEHLARIGSVRAAAAEAAAEAAKVKAGEARANAKRAEAIEAAAASAAAAAAAAGEESSLIGIGSDFAQRLGFAPHLVRAISSPKRSPKRTAQRDVLEHTEALSKSSPKGASKTGSTKPRTGAGASTEGRENSAARDLCGGGSDTDEHEPAKSNMFESDTKTSGRRGVRGSLSLPAGFRFEEDSPARST